MSDQTLIGIRRIVTGHDSNGKVIIITDGPTPDVKNTPNRPGVVLNNMWMDPRGFREPTAGANPIQYAAG